MGHHFSRKVVIYRLSSASDPHARKDVQSGSRLRSGAAVRITMNGLAVQNDDCDDASVLFTEAQAQA